MGYWIRVRIILSFSNKFFLILNFYRLYYVFKHNIKENKKANANENEDPNFVNNEEDFLHHLNDNLKPFIMDKVWIKEYLIVYYNMMSF